LVACSSASGTSEGASDGGPMCLFCVDATTDASVEVQVRGTIDQICSSVDGCHGEGVGGMGLSPGHEFDAMINVTSTENPPMKRVLPGDPAHSYVYIKLACEGGIAEGGCMPPASTTDPRLARLFHDWIEAGAPTE
jgi:hypothetical protein